MTNVKRTFNDFAGRIFGGSYYRAAIQTKLLLSSRAEPVVIWQMGKVGSSSILNSLHQSRTGTAIFHVHVLSDALIARGELFKKARLRGSRAYLSNIALREQLLRGNRRWKIISLVREPVGRNISAFFQNLDIYAPKISGADVTQSQMLYDKFFDEFDHERPLMWFDQEIKHLIGIDVFAQPFPKEQGYAQYSTDMYDLLVIRMEDLNVIGAQALSEFMKMPHFNLANANIGAEKNYANIYARIRSQIKFPRDYLEHMYESKYAHHFYTEEETAEFRARWANQMS